MEFEWDAAKEELNILKHGVSFSEAASAFWDPNGFVLEDRMHSSEETRYYHVGMSRNERVLTTRFTYRHEIIRIIGSAEWRKFRRLYYERTQTE